MSLLRLSLRIIFMGTPAFGLPTLKALIDRGHQIVAVYTQPPRPAGRGHHLQKSPIHLFAESLSIPVFTPKSLRREEEQKIFIHLNADVAVVVAYGLILPRPILTAPRWGCVNVHASLLPRWRGAAPIQRAILAGDQETGITLMHMDEGLDTGPILTMPPPVPITLETTAGSLHDALATLGEKYIVPTIEHLASGALKSSPQPTEGMTYAPKLGREEGQLNWTEETSLLDRKVRALHPWPGTWFDYKGERIKVISASLVADAPSSIPGVLLDDLFTVSCGNGALRLTTLQRPGRKSMDGADVMRGLHLKPGDRLV